MMTHSVWVKADKARLGVTRSLSALVKRSVRATLALLEAQLPCEVSILYTDEAGIRQINLEHRGEDKPTDVLSFPQQTLVPEQPLTEDLADPGSGRVALGDIALSLPAAQAQAVAYSHSYERELSYLTVHATLHLLGFDHERGKKEEMRLNELTEAVLATLGLGRGVHT